MLLCYDSATHGIRRCIFRSLDPMLREEVLLSAPEDGTPVEPLKNQNGQPVVFVSSRKRFVPGYSVCVTFFFGW